MSQKKAKPAETNQGTGERQQDFFSELFAPTGVLTRLVRKFPRIIHSQEQTASNSWEADRPSIRVRLNITVNSSHARPLAGAPVSFTRASA
jgi:hypothetical protein